MCAMDIIYCWSHDCPLDIDRDDLTAYKCRSSSGVSIGLLSKTTTVVYGVRSGTKSILRFRGLENTSSLRKLFFESLSVVFVASVPCLRVVTSLFSSYCFLRGTAGFLRGVGMGLCRRCVSVASFLCLRVVGSSFRRLHYILDSGIKVNFSRLCTSSAYKVQFDWFLL